MDRPEPVPDLDWDPGQARRLGEGALDVWTELVDRLRDRDLPVGRRHTATEVREAVTRPVPDEAVPVADLVAYLRELVLDWSTYPGHPGFFAYISGAGTVPGAAADLLAAAVNQNLGGWRLSPAATEIELHLTHWFASRLGLPDGAGGLITSGGAMANLIALGAARRARAGWDVRTDGVRAGPPLALYASSEVHDVIDRAADVLGLGSAAVRHVPVDDAYRMRVQALEEAVAADLEAGVRPLAVVASAGTVETGAIDPIDAIADVCATHEVWLHVDGAYGAGSALTSAQRHRFPGINRADSIAFDPHKWLYTPHSGGCVLVRDMSRLRDAYGVHPDYTYEDKDLTGRGTDLLEYSPQFSRGFHALKVWVSLLAHGWDAYERRISHDIGLAAYLHRRADAHPELETMAPQSLSIACYRYVPPDLSDGDGRNRYLDQLNERLMAELQMAGGVYPSNAVLDGRFALRLCIVNFRTEAADVDALVDATVTLGRRLDDELRPDGL